MESFQDFAIVEMNAKLEQTPQHSEERAIFQNQHGSDAETHRVTSSRRAFSQSPFQFASTAKMSRFPTNITAKDHAKQLHQFIKETLRNPVRTD